MPEQIDEFAQAGIGRDSEVLLARRCGVDHVGNKGTEGIKSVTEVIQRHEVHVGSRLIASVPLIGAD